MPRERIVQSESEGEAETRANYALRPTSFDQYIGQEQLIRKLSIAVQAAKSRSEPVDHTLLHGPPGLGKTTLAHVIANEVGAQVYVTNGPALTKGADLVGILTKLNKGDVLFIDEIHRLPPVVEEYLYPAMEDFKVDIPLDSGMHARAVTFDIQPFTLIGATTRIGLLTGPMRGRFGIAEHIEFYTPESLHEILKINATLLKVPSEDQALWELARRSRGTPRVANRLLRRSRDFATVEGAGKLTLPITQQALELARIDERRTRRAGSLLPPHDHRRLRRRPGRHRGGRRNHGRRARHARGRDRAVPASAGDGHAHAAGPPRDEAGI